MCFCDIYHNNFQDPTLGGVSVATTSEVRTVVMLEFTILGNLKIEMWNCLYWRDVHTKFHE
jgi:hypothetical protein